MHESELGSLLSSGSTLRLVTVTLTPPLHRRKGKIPPVSSQNLPMERLTWQIRHGLLGRQTKFTSALAPLLGKEFHFSAAVPISLCNPWVFAILLGVGRNASAVGNNTDTGRAKCQESHFTRSPGPGSRTSMSCTHRASSSSVFDRQRKPRGWPGSALCPPLPSPTHNPPSIPFCHDGH